MTEQTQNDVDLRDPQEQARRMYPDPTPKPHPRRGEHPKADLVKRFYGERAAGNLWGEDQSPSPAVAKRQAVAKPPAAAKPDQEDLTSSEALERRMYPKDTTEPEQSDEEVEAEEHTTDTGDDEPAELKVEGVDAHLLTAFQKSAQELGIEQDAQQKLLDGIVPKVRQLQEEAIAEAREGWVEQAQRDELLSGDRGFDHNLGVAQKALELFGTPELTTLLDESGLGDHPEMLKLMLKVGRRLGRN